VELVDADLFDGSSYQESGMRLIKSENFNKYWWEVGRIKTNKWDLKK